MKDKTQGILLIIAGTIMHLYLGCFFLWGNIAVYVTSYLHKHNESITLDDTSVIFPVQMVASALFTPIAPFAMKKLPPWLCCILGAVIAIGSCFVSSFTSSLILFTILYGFCFGLGIGPAYMCPIIAGWEYFPNRKGMVNGIIVAGFGFGSFIFSFISVAIVNPGNEAPTLEVTGGKIFSGDNPISERAPLMIRVNALLWAVLCIISIPFIRRKKQRKITVQDVESKRKLLINTIESSENGDALSAPSMEKVSVEAIYKTRLREALISWKSLHICMIMFASSLYPYYLASNFKSFGMQEIDNDHFITIVGAIGAISNGASRLGWAVLSDYFGFKKVYLCLVILQIINAFTLTQVACYSMLYLVWIAVAFACLGGHFALFAPLSAKVFGGSIGSTVYTFLFASFAVSSIVTFILTKQTGSGNISRDILFYILGGSSVVAFLLALLFSETLFIPSKVKMISKSQNHSSRC
ncbi:unnamed protein product [Moneuplotes crassus]|uniref:Major facilitator superfamily (MFS) profile domain-containing protein n=1 Tax=Euplotes crassus TaxID=5936 RepID=A0AAD1UKI7_EUPCR|nr:unnamed protein product [Moneuplotes crassus]